ncbi:MAG: transposase [Candidatus Hydrogenedentota bacterium]|nr:MAG: transposase [Candidatus Hydrogenedentota bacterium]
MAAFHTLFLSKSDRKMCLRLPSEQGERSGISFLAYCLMANHVHLIVVPNQPDSLARGIGEAHRLYTRAMNFRQKVRGHLFRERFYSCPVDTRQSHSSSAVH